MKDNIAQLSPPASQKMFVMKEAYVFSDGAKQIHCSSRYKSAFLE
jgi:hypothetical protein